MRVLERPPVLDRVPPDREGISWSQVLRLEETSWSYEWTLGASWSFKPAARLRSLTCHLEVLGREPNAAVVAPLDVEGWSLQNVIARARPGRSPQGAGEALR